MDQHFIDGLLSDHFVFYGTVVQLRVEPKYMYTTPTHSTVCIYSVYLKCKV